MSSLLRASRTHRALIATTAVDTPSSAAVFAAMSTRRYWKVWLSPTLLCILQGAQIAGNGCEATAKTIDGGGEASWVGIDDVVSEVLDSCFEPPERAGEGRGEMLEARGEGRGERGEA